ncbi:MAG: alkaline phosphatase D family protein [Candidatus Sericytochromatia bacterium]
MFKSSALVIPLLLGSLQLALAAPPHTPTASEQTAFSKLRGPMLGAIEMREARIWLQSSLPGTLELRYWPQSQPEQGQQTRRLTLHPKSDGTVTALLPSLQPGTRYAYRLLHEGKNLGQGPWFFQTQTDWFRRSEPPDFTVALGSCVFLNGPDDPPGGSNGGDYGIFKAISAQRPELMLWLGDNVYLRHADFYAASAIRARYAQLRDLPELQTLLHSSAHYAIWDDHDYGEDNSDRSYSLREDSLQIFQDWWANPSYGQPQTPGVFGTFHWADVSFFLTDNRYHRAPNRLKDPHKAFFGPAQLQWLKDSLSASNATFKLVVIGNQVLNTRSPSENMYSYTSEYRDFLNWLDQSGIEGVILISGDRHHSELLKVNRPGNYPLYEWTVSPLTSKAYSPFPEEQELPERVSGSLFSERNFGLLSVSGPRQKRQLHLKLHDAQGTLRWEYRLQADALKRPPAAQP